MTGDGPEALKRGFLHRLGTAIAGLRARAGLSHSQVAECTRLSVDVLKEVDVDPGKLTLEEFVDLTLACGYIPLDVTLAPEADVRDFVREAPQAPRGATAFEAWKARRSVRQALAAAANTRPD